MESKNYVDTTETTSCLEWCAGYGGISLGLKRAIPSLRTIAFGEIEAFACANLVAKMEAGLLDAAPIWTDIKTFPCESFRDRVDILVAGYPCQPFSAAGKRLGADDPRHLWPHILRAIGIIRPRLCFFENVEGHISLGLCEVLGDLGAAGYTAAWGIFSASEVGAPHQRKRVFILAYDQRERVEELGRQIAVGSQLNTAWDDGGMDNANAMATGGIAGVLGGAQSEEQGEGLQRQRAGHAAGYASEAIAWPSRPGEPQHGWEPPRVVGDTKHTRHGQNVEPGNSGAPQSGRESYADRAELPSGQAVANDNRPHAGHGKQRPERTLGDLSGGCGETMGNADHGRLASGINARSGAEATQGGQGNIEQADGGAMGNASSQRCQQDSALRSEQQPSRIGEERGLGAAEAMGNATQRKDNGRESRDMGQEAGEGRCGDDASGDSSEDGGLAHTGSLGRGGWRDGDAAGLRGEIQAAGSCGGGTEAIGNADCYEIKSPMGDPIDGTTAGMGHAKLSSISDSELAEIREWMVKCDNRTDELRLLGNGVVPATAEQAFRVLIEELNK